MSEKMKKSVSGFRRFFNIPSSVSDLELAKQIYERYGDDWIHSVELKSLN